MKKSISLLLIGLIIASCENNKNKDNAVDLNDKSISSVVIDKSNTIWVGTEEGLYKSVDGGYKLESSLSADKILSLGYNESSDILWIGTINGLYKATIASGNLSVNPVNASVLSNDKVNSTYTDPVSKTWFATNKGITMNTSDTYKKEEFLTNELGDKLTLYIEDAVINGIGSWDGDYYFATSGAGLYRAYDFVDSLDGFTGASILGAPYNGMAISDTMYSIFVDSQGRQWMGGTAGLQSHTGHDTKMDNIFYYDELADGHVHAISEAPDGKIWAGTEKGLSIFNGTTWSTVTADLPDLFVTAIAFDKVDGSAWVGTKKGIVNIK
jgi:ligand-binding sensor domain-containing protein